MNLCELSNQVIILNYNFEAEYNSEIDFENTIGKYISFYQGLTAEQLSRKLGISPLIMRIKLKIAVKKGKVVVDNRIEGIRYFRNFILNK